METIPCSMIPENENIGCTFFYTRTHSLCLLKREGKFEQSRAESWRRDEARIFSGFPRTHSLLTGLYYNGGNDGNMLELHNDYVSIVNKIISSLQIN